MGNRQTRLTILVDNVPGDNELSVEHGFSCCIGRGSSRIVFDTGQTGLVVQNAGRLGEDLRSAESIVLSHGHYDHTGGLPCLFAEKVGVNLYAHPEAFCPKYVRDKDGKVRFIGIPVTISEVRNHIGIVWTLGPTEIAEGIHVTGPIPRTTNFEDTGGDFFADETCRRPDLLLDDQALFWESRNGLVVLLGCAHAGVVNTLNYVCRLMNNKRVHAVLGGMHLGSASRSRLEATVESFRELDIKVIGSTHCTGSEVMAYLRDQMPDRYHDFRTGFVFELE